MLGKTYTITLSGIEGQVVLVEANLMDGLPSFDMVGIPGSEVREARERVRTALQNCGLFLPPKRITINLSPADIRKKGTGFDLPIAVSLLAGMEYYHPELWESISESSIFCGEISLDGSLCETHGILSMVLCAKDSGFQRCFVPYLNAEEAACVSGIDIIAVHSLIEVVALLQNPEALEQAVIPTITWDSIKKERLISDEKAGNRRPDFKEVNGQEAARRAAEIAAAGMHNLLMTGPPGSGKSMIARRIPSILPPLSYEESLEISRIHSVHGLLLPGEHLLTARPFRSPHHTISASALVGGGFYPNAGEISLADRGVLFLDELPEFHRKTLEVLRQPMEDHKVYISRVQGRYVFPANTMIVAAMNPCPCGFYPDRARCSCTDWEIKRYRNTISGPLLDRIDLCIEVLPIAKEELYKESSQNESSAEIQKRVLKAHALQQERFEYEHIFFNADMSSSMVKRYCIMDQSGKDFIQNRLPSTGFSTRGYYKLLKTARTIADLSESSFISAEHLMEACCYRFASIR